MNLRNMIMVGATVMAMCGGAIGDVTVTELSARQRFPWNGLVDINYTIDGDVSAMGDFGVTFSAQDIQNGRTYQLQTFTVAPVLKRGKNLAVWDAKADVGVIYSTNIVYILKIGKMSESLLTHPLYCVIDVRGGSSAEAYPISYMNEIPNNGVWGDEYKTGKIVLKKVNAGTYYMQGDRQVTLTKQFYIGVFEITQRQYQLVMGSNPSIGTGVARPVGGVSYDMIRGSGAGAQYPASSAVDDASFIGVLQKRTGLKFDLPTEAQWEYACRAGTVADADIKLYGRYNGNASDQKGGYPLSTGIGYGYQSFSWSTTVGSYLPNNWGLYDMRGNESEWVLDWYGELDSSDATDPIGPTSGSSRVVRGGHYYDAAGDCLSTGRRGIKSSISTWSFSPGGVEHWTCDCYGFRIALTVE